MPNFKTRLLASLIRLLPLWFHQRIGLSLMFILSLGLPCLVWLPLTRSLSVGAFDIRSYLGVFVVTFAHVVSLWISHLVLLLVFYSGHQRFGLHKPSSMPKWLKVIGDSSFFALLFPLPLTIFKISFDSDGFHFSFLLKVLAFFFAVAFAFFIIKFFVVNFKKMDVYIDQDFYPIEQRKQDLSAATANYEQKSTIELLERFRFPYGLQEKIPACPLPPFLIKPLARFSSWQEKKATQVMGYFFRKHEELQEAKAENRKQVPSFFAGFLNQGLDRISVGHRYLYFLTTSFAILVVGLGLLAHFADSREEGILIYLRFPTVLFLILITTTILLSLSLFAFILDRYRVPLLFFVLIAICILSLLPHNHFDFEEVKSTYPSPSSPRTVLRNWQKQTENDETNLIPIVVSVEGGGIHAGAWGTHILASLESKLQEEYNYNFGRSIVCVSGVSGGAYGLMYWIDSYGKHEAEERSLPSNKETLFATTRGRAMRSSLGSAARAFLYGDLPAALPLLSNGSLPNRAETLQDSWAKGYHLYNHKTKDFSFHPGLREVTLDTWVEDVNQGHRPAFLASTTNLDRGERVVFGTSSLQMEGGFSSTPNYLKNDHHTLWGDLNLPVATASRLSATFPFVSPASQLERDCKGGHFGDGGYYDASGVLTLTDWLAAAYGIDLSSQKTPIISDELPSKLIFLRIEVFPYEEGATTRARYGTNKDGILYQAKAPLTGLFNVRGAIQKENAVLRLSSLRKIVNLTSNGTTEIVEIKLPYIDTEIAPPLSWHLTRPQMSRIAETTLKLPYKDKQGIDVTQKRLQRQDLSVTRWSPLMGTGNSPINPTINTPPKLLFTDIKAHQQINEAFVKLTEELGLAQKTKDAK